MSLGRLDGVLKEFFRSTSSVPRPLPPPQKDLLFVVPNGGGKKGVFGEGIAEREREDVRETFSGPHKNQDQVPFESPPLRETLFLPLHLISISSLR